MLPFIIATPSGQLGEDKRKFVRSHVMRGKNRKKRPSKPPSWISGGEIDRPIEVARAGASRIPAKVGGELSLTALAAEKLGPYMLDSIWKSKAYFNHIDGQRGNDGTAALVHSVKALAILQQRLAGGDHDLPISDSTILVVVGLTMATTAVGDLETAQKHLTGLHKMVELRGGILAFRANRQLQAKILRQVSVDLGVALSTGRSPAFFSDSISWVSYIAVSQGRIPLSGTQLAGSGSAPKLSAPDLEHFLDGMDVRLRFVWDDVVEYARAANIATQCQLSIDQELYQEVMVSVHYRLVNLCFDIGDVDEAFRLALLAFASTLFLQWRGIKPRYEHLSWRLSIAVSPLGRKTRDQLPAQLAFWLHVIAAVFISNGHEKAGSRLALVDILRDMKLESWNEARSVLKTILWVDALHDPLAKQLVEDIFSGHRK
ncbi:hypothetical protein SLS62_006009 [Diatrype stigma]|uniref:Uncharacterized protein n=1 Tax=Diatrype stigma TaxID=117547 RepID=A0AAN9YSA7_9PEZI